MPHSLRAAAVQQRQQKQQQQLQPQLQRQRQQQLRKRQLLLAFQVRCRFLLSSSLAASHYMAESSVAALLQWGRGEGGGGREEGSCQTELNSNLLSMLVRSIDRLRKSFAA